MFLTGIFMKSLNPDLERETVGTTKLLLDQGSLIQPVKEFMYEIVGAVNNGVSFTESKSMERYAWAIVRNKDVKDKLEKIRHREYALYEREGGETSMPKGTFDMELLHSEMSLVEQPTTHWSTLVSKQTIEALLLKAELQEHMDEYNEATDYFENTYGFNFKEVLLRAIEGVKKSRDFLTYILSLEKDATFLDSFYELVRYQEFYDFLHSDGRYISFDYV